MPGGLNVLVVTKSSPFCSFQVQWKLQLSHEILPGATLTICALFYERISSDKHVSPPNDRCRRGNFACPIFKQNHANHSAVETGKQPNFSLSFLTKVAPGTAQLLKRSANPSPCLAPRSHMWEFTDSFTVMQWTNLCWTVCRAFLEKINEKFCWIDVSNVPVLEAFVHVFEEEIRRPFLTEQVERNFVWWSTSALRSLSFARTRPSLSTNGKKSSSSCSWNAQSLIFSNWWYRSQISLVAIMTNVVVQPTSKF